MTNFASCQQQIIDTLPKPQYPSPYQALLRAGHRLRQLQQVHAHLIAAGRHHCLPLVTNLATSAIAAGAIFYARQLLLSTATPDAFLFSSLINTASKSNYPHHAVFFYAHMLRHNFSPTNYTYTTVIKACGQRGEVNLGRVVHCHVLANGYGSDGYVQAALVSFYAKSGDLNVARKMFDGMPEKSVVCWNAMISGYEQNGLAEEAINLFSEMRNSGVEWDSATFVCVLSACAQVGALELGNWVHEYLMRTGFSVNVVLGTALINMYARCGNVSEARKVFDSMRERNVVTWTSMISGCGTHGYGKEAIGLFELMRSQGPIPNGLTYVAVLSACSHAGLVQEGRKIFSQMKDYGVDPGLEHQVCMVDMLGRAGLLDEALQFILDLHHTKPTPAALWTAMLAACRMHKNYHIGYQAAENLLLVEPEIAGNYVLLSNMYASAGSMDRVELVRNMMMRRGLKKHVGYSTIEIDQKVHLFSTGDKSHPERTPIYQFLDDLMQKIKAAGYVTLSCSAMHELEEEERGYALRYHSEKLAVAYGLLKTRQGTTIRIMKNLRICEDCHMAMKSISVISSREIVVRDKLRFHHFKNGSCSCKDYW